MYRMRDIRKHQGMTQEEFGVALGVTKQTIYKWENGKGVPIDLDEKLEKFIRDRDISHIFPPDRKATKLEIILSKQEIMKLMLEAEMTALTARNIIDKLSKYL